MAATTLLLPSRTQPKGHYRTTSPITAASIVPDQKKVVDGKVELSLVLLLATRIVSVPLMTRRDHRYRTLDEQRGRPLPPPKEPHHPQPHHCHNAAGNSSENPPSLVTVQQYDVILLFSVPHVLNNRSTVPLSFFPAYGALSFIPWSFKPSHAYLDVTFVVVAKAGMAAAFGTMQSTLFPTILLAFAPIVFVGADGVSWYHESVTI